MDTPKTWSQFDKWLKGYHLKGKRAQLTITRATIETTHPNGREQATPVLWFKETQKGLPLSDINRAMLVKLFGDDPAQCIGKIITLEAMPMTVAGASKLPVRIIGNGKPSEEQTK
jgi:hypothetical protein